MNVKRTGGAAAGILATLALVVLLFVGVGLGMGWVHVSDNPDKSTIEIDKVKLQEDTDKAAAATKNMINESAESLKRATEDVEEATDNDSYDETHNNVTPIEENSDMPG